MTRHGNTLLALLIAGFSTALLLGLRFDAVWAGGSGRVPACPATLLSDDASADSSIARGELMQTTAGQQLKYQICDSTVVYLDENTQLKLAAYQDHPTPTALELIQGRVIVDGVAGVKARNVAFATTGAACEFVHYSWRNELDVAPLVVSGCTGSQTTNVVPEFTKTTRFNTFDGSVVTTLPFSPTTSSAKPFYDWTALVVTGME